MTFGFGFYSFAHPAPIRPVEGANKDFALGQGVTWLGPGALNLLVTTAPTDNNDTTSLNGTVTAMPQTFTVTLTQSRYIRQVRLVFTGTGTQNVAQDGQLQYQDEVCGEWVTTASWVGVLQTTLLLPGGGPAKRWRLRGTRSGNPGATGINLGTFALFG